MSSGRRVWLTILLGVVRLARGRLPRVQLRAVTWVAPRAPCEGPSPPSWWSAAAGLAAPHIDLEEASVAVAPLAVLLDALGDGHPHVRVADAGAQSHPGRLPVPADRPRLSAVRQPPHHLKPAHRVSYRRAQSSANLNGYDRDRRAMHGPTHLPRHLDHCRARSDQRAAIAGDTGGEGFVGKVLVVRRAGQPGLGRRLPCHGRGRANHAGLGD